MLNGLSDQVSRNLSFKFESELVFYISSTSAFKKIICRPGYRNDHLKTHAPGHMMYNLQ